MFLDKQKKQDKAFAFTTSPLHHFTASPLRRFTAFAAMLSVVNTNSNFAYHTIANAEFTAAFIKVINNDFTSFYKYHLFIRYGEMVYIDIGGVGEVIISIAELHQDRYLRFYYELSLMLTNNKHLVIEDLVYSSENNEEQIYKYRIY